jgi:glutaminyl-peptide cyclotransferase
MFTKLNKLTVALISLVLLNPAFAETSNNTANNASKNSTHSVQFDIKNLDRAMKRFVATPHPMGSTAQKKLAREIKTELTQYGWDAQLHSFTTKIPNLDAVKFGGKSKSAASSKLVTGENIVALSKGSDRCMVVIGGHYDTKFYKDIKFVGANDGGSSTALMQEMARVISQVRKQEVNDANKFDGRFLDCTIALTFFDGEEATLTEWSDAEKAIGLVDNTYGSRELAKNIERQFEGLLYQNLPIKAVMVIDMIGHKNQQLFITNGSHLSLTQKFLEQKTDVLINAANITISDDHQAFAQLGIPYLHIIDWTNLNEWHTAKDDLSIISTQKMANFGEHILRFLKQKR